MMQIKIRGGSKSLSLIVRRSLSSLTPNLLKYTKLVIAALTGALFCGCSAKRTGHDADSDAGRNAGRPNIVLIMADDMGYSDIGCYGSEIATPHLDALAENGVRLLNFYNGARCCPTRASLLTGVYPHEAGMGGMVSKRGSKPESGPYQGYLSRETVTIAEVLREAGYSTYMSGKWHVGENPEHWPRKRGFDRYFGLISGASSYFEIIRDQPRVRQMALDDDPWEPPHEGFYMTDAFSDFAVKFIREHEEKSKDRPFFLYLAYTAPHWPLHAPEEEIAKYRGKYNIGWDSLRTLRYERMKKLGIIDDTYALSPRPESIPAWEDVEDKEEWATKMAVYAAMIDRMDQGIGKVLETLKQNGEWDNTLILFLSDNGGCAEDVAGRKLNDPSRPIGTRGSFVAYNEPWANVSNTPFRKYKQWTYEGGIATPLIAHWPQVIHEGGKIRKKVSHVMDIMATCLEAGDASYPETYQGHKIKPLRGESLLPAFRGKETVKETEKERTLYWEHFGSKAVRQGDWKLVMGKNSDSWELYDLHADPTETRDLSSQEPERTAEMARLYQAWAAEAGVKDR